MRLKERILDYAALIAITACCGCAENTPVQAVDNGDDAVAIQVTSSAFQQKGTIPSKYTCDGSDVSPPLKWSAGPQGTVSYALIMDDPDAPVGTWVHWVAWNITGIALDENLSKKDTLPGGGMQGTNSWKKLGYGGPCPPSGTHRYFFKVYALDAKLSIPSSAGKQQMLDAMKGHILAEGELMGTYARKR